MPWWGWLVIAFVIWTVVNKARGLLKGGVPANLDEGMAQFKELMQKNEMLSQLGDKLGVKSLLEEKLAAQAPAAVPPLPGASPPAKPRGTAEKPRAKLKSQDDVAADKRSEEMRTQGAVERQKKNLDELLEAWRYGSWIRADEVARRIVWEEETAVDGLKNEAPRLALLYLGTSAYRTGALQEARAFMIASTADVRSLDAETAAVLEKRAGKMGKMLSDRWRRLQAA